ncbi:MAG: C13 family peptidase [Candidatus Thorarchaeota archaeon]|jgi:hypothetical protein
MSKKKKKSMSRIPIAIILILIITNVSTLVYFLYGTDSVASEDVPNEIWDLTATDMTEHIGKVLTIRGYFVVAGVYPLLVSDLLYYANNSLEPGNYVMVTGAVPEALVEAAGAKVDIKGQVSWADTTEEVLGVSCDAHTIVDRGVVEAGYYQDQLISPDILQDLIPVDFDANKYAVIFSGGIQPGKDYTRYWNNIIWMYFILQMHGYDAENIYVIYRDGVGNDPYTPVHYPATHASLETVFGELEDELGSRDQLFIYTTNHGGSGGLGLWNPLDSGYVSHAEFKGYIENIICNRMIIVMGQCFSGKFIEHLSASNRVIITACDVDETTLMCDTEGNWDEFAFHFMSALVQFSINSDGTDILSDMSGDGLVSMAEAFNWVAARDSRPEHPQYDDDGDGEGWPMFVVYMPGQSLGASTFL